MATQSGLALSLYEGNVNITCNEFVLEFALAFPSLPPKTAALYWQNRARRAKFGLPPTAVPAEYKDAVEAKAPKAPKEKAVKATVKRMAAEVIAKTKPVKAKVELAPDEMAKIKAANLARLQEVSARTRKYTNVARPEGPGVDGFDSDEARAEVETILHDDSFAMPKFLTKDALKAMI
jgi:hypothetical protein